MTGRPARGLMNRAMRELGPLTDAAPAFPLAANALAPLRAKAEAQGSGDFSPMWSGQAAALGRELRARELTQNWPPRPSTACGGWAERVEARALLDKTALCYTASVTLPLR